MNIRQSKTLHLVLAFKWFDLIKSGQKTIEYRETSPYWNKKFGDYEYLCYDKVRFQRGYAKSPETMLFEIKKIYQTHSKNDLNLPCVWAIELGKANKEQIK